MPQTMQEEAIDIKVYGLVQGVGFRPFIYGLASDLKLAGWALNRNECVEIRVQGDARRLKQFLLDLERKAPPLSKIESVIAHEAKLEDLESFRILQSHSASAEVTRVSPDVAVCSECLEDMRIQSNRVSYPFTNCTNCGPRFSIVQDLPYDRVKTTMSVFVMCPQCQEEYEDLWDRRFHAQPNACRECGPEYELVFPLQTHPPAPSLEKRGGDVDLSPAINSRPQSSRTLKRPEKQDLSCLSFEPGLLCPGTESIETILETSCHLLEVGKILAIKGIGGFHLACDASNEDAVAALRQRKQREGKPFAVMFGSLESVRQYVQVSPSEEKLLLSEKRPILLLDPLRQGKQLALSVTRGLLTLGVMLPYTPFHHLLFERFNGDALVLTSGNVSDEPIAIDNATACDRLAGIADAFLLYNRDIHNRSDDSVARVVNGKSRIIRRSRGWAPEPVSLNLNVEGIVATGAELKNCFCVGKGTQAILSQHIGDLKNFETYAFYEEAFERFQRLFRVRPELIVCDRHPDYLSTRFAREQGLPLVQIQHHHAHIASCMAEHALDEKVIGISLDGTGLGDDDKIWGGEFLICDLNSYERFSHFDYVPMPGGDRVVKEPWRMGLAYLYHSFGRACLDLPIPFCQQLEQNKVQLLLAAIDKGLNCPLTSSLGRLFDAVAAIVNLTTLASFEAEGPIRLEAQIEPSNESYPSQCETTVSVAPLIREIVSDLQGNVPTGLIAAKFHNSIVEITVEIAEKIREERGLNIVALSGGVFQNRYVLEKSEERLKESKFDVYSHSTIPTNDGGICLGQMAIAAKRRALGIL